MRNSIAAATADWPTGALDPYTKPAQHMLPDALAMQRQPPHLAQVWPGTVGARGSLGNDRELAAIRDALSLHPYDTALQTRYESSLQQRRGPSRAGAIGLIITCEKYFDRALRLHAKLSALNTLPLQLVVGRGARVPVHVDLLEIDAPDDYESLPRKVREAFLHAHERHGCAVFKIDDDLQITDAVRFSENVRALLGADIDYAGFKVGCAAHDRTWHWGKCREATLNRTPYGRRFLGPWANGPFYYLSAIALRAFALSALRFPAEIEGELYEDKFVGDTLRAEGIRLSPLEAGSAGVAADNLPSASPLSYAPELQNQTEDERPPECCIDPARQIGQAIDCRGSAHTQCDDTGDRSTAASVHLGPDRRHYHCAATPAQEPREHRSMNTTSLAIQDTTRAIAGQIADTALNSARAALKSALAARPRDPMLIALAQRATNLYAADFYDEQHAGSLISARRILSILWKHHPCTRVCDFGAGLGTWLRTAHELGASQLAGFEGPWALEHPHRFHEAAYFAVDLNEDVNLTEPFDLAISVEVAEHLLPERSESFVRDLCRASDVVLFGAALPRQPGDGHINCRPHSFWIEEFRRNGYVCLDAFRPHVWTDPAVEPWYAQNCYLFVAHARRYAFAELHEASLVDVYHPLLVNGFVLGDHRAGTLDPGPAADARRAPRPASDPSLLPHPDPQPAVCRPTVAATPMQQEAEAHWCRIMMNQTVQAVVSAAPLEQSHVLEISGTAWQHCPFGSYTSVRYPGFDLCNDVLPQAFDLVIAEQVFEHLRHPARAAANVLQMLKPGGSLLITTPFLIRYHPEPLDLWRWTADGLRAFLEDCGFVDVQTQSWGNRDCVIANLSEWAAYRPGHDLSDDPRFPVVVWGLARRPLS